MVNDNESYGMYLKGKKIEFIRKECRTRNLNATGNKKKLVNRLKKYRRDKQRFKT